MKFKLVEATIKSSNPDKQALWDKFFNEYSKVNLKLSQVYQSLKDINDDVQIPLAERSLQRLTNDYKDIEKLVISNTSTIDDIQSRLAEVAKDMRAAKSLINRNLGSSEASDASNQISSEESSDKQPTSYKIPEARLSKFIQLCLNLGKQLFFKDSNNQIKRVNPKKYSEIKLDQLANIYISRTGKEGTDLISVLDNLKDKNLIEELEMKFKLVEAAESKICCICKKPFEGYGNNAEPVCSGSCCDEGNMKEVIPARMRMLDNSSSEDLDEAKVDDQIPGQISIFDNFRKFVEMPAFRKAWKNEGLTEDDLRDLQNQILNNPENAISLGDQLFKIRFSPKSLNKGKSGGYRVFYIDAIIYETIYLVDIINKSRQDNINSNELSDLRQLSTNLRGE